MSKLKERLSAVCDNKCFSKIVLFNSYLYVAVAEEDRKYFVIPTEKALFQYKRLPTPSFDGLVVYFDDILSCAFLSQIMNDMQTPLPPSKVAKLSFYSKESYNVSDIQFLRYI